MRLNLSRIKRSEILDEDRGKAHEATPLAQKKNPTSMMQINQVVFIRLEILAALIKETLTPNTLHFILYLLNQTP